MLSVSNPSVVFLHRHCGAATEGFYEPLQTTTFAYLLIAQLCKTMIEAMTTMAKNL